MEDRAIVQLFFERPEEAIRAADRKYGKLCYKIAHNILNSSGDAEECVNDAYLGAWNTIPPARPEPLGAYLCKIVRNLALNRYHAGCALKRGGGNCAVALEELEECLASGSSVEDSLAGQELVRLIEGFLDGLSVEDRVIFLGRYWFAACYRDIAARTGMSEKAVSVRLVRLRKRLRRYLKERGVFL